MNNQNEIETEVETEAIKNNQSKFQRLIEMASNHIYITGFIVMVFFMSPYKLGAAEVIGMPAVIAAGCWAFIPHRISIIIMGVITMFLIGGAM